MTDVWFGRKEEGIGQPNPPDARSYVFALPLDTIVLSYQTTMPEEFHSWILGCLTVLPWEF